MELINEFTVNRPIHEAWAVITDVERIAPCLPGAQLQEIEGDSYRGVVKVKVGPISAALKGEAHFLERDDANYRAVLKGDGRDTKGNGNASAIITASLQQISPTSAKCTVHTKLDMTGKVAQFGRGALADISGKLMQQFSKNLDAMLEKDAAQPAAAGAPPSEAPVAETAATSDPASVTNEPAAPTIRIINGPAAEPIDALRSGGSAILKRLLPALGGLVLLLLVFRRRKN
jgi:carbon monoxide dehydrogenase subunit G